MKLMGYSMAIQELLVDMRIVERVDGSGHLNWKINSKRRRQAASGR